MGVKFLEEEVYVADTLAQAAETRVRAGRLGID